MKALNIFFIITSLTFGANAIASSSLSLHLYPTTQATEVTETVETVEPSSSMFGAIISAFQSGNATQLAQHFADEVEISVFDDDQVYDKSEAQEAMRKFFDSHKPNGFAKEHEGTSPSGANYCIGTLKTSSGDYRVFIQAKMVGGKKIIQQIQIEGK